MLVNVGSFSGKTIAKPVRVALGLQWVPLYSAGAAVIGLLLVLFFYWPDRAKRDDAATEPARPAITLRHVAKVLKNGRFLAIILITSGFWAIQGQLYASMPKYVLRTVGDTASPEWYANVDPFLVVLLVVPLTQLMKRRTAVTSIGVGLLLMPLSALTMALSPSLSGAILGIHPVTVMMILGIGLMGIAECFLSPRYLELASRQAPPGQEGLYLGYAQLNTFVAWLAGFIASGYLLDAFCPDPAKLSDADRAQRLEAIAGRATMPAPYAHAHYIWYFFAAVGATAFAALLVFARVTREKRASSSLSR
jgi:dipeptide/tripeptide permease